ncbi:MAG: hypothetical protein ACQEUD_11725 [Bacillota bacterium]
MRKEGCLGCLESGYGILGFGKLVVCDKSSILLGFFIGAAGFLIYSAVNSINSANNTIISQDNLPFSADNLPFQKIFYQFTFSAAAPIQANLPSRNRHQTQKGMILCSFGSAWFLPSVLRSSISPQNI